MDSNRDRVEIIALLVRRMFQQACIETEVTTTQSLEEAIQGADFLISQVRIGGLAARVRDERVPMELGMVGNETVGAGGFASALRTVPFAVELASLVERLSPHTLIINFTNPSGIVTEAIIKHTRARVVGLCNIPTDLRMGFASYLGVDVARVMLDYFGLNHLGWVRAVYVDGENVLPRLIEDSEEVGKGLYAQGLVDSLIPPNLLRSWGMVPNWYVRFYCRPDAVLAEQRRAKKVRGETDQVTDARLFGMYARGEFGPEAEHLLDQKGGTHYAEAALDIIASIVHDRRERLVLDVENRGTITELPSNVCVEVPTRVGQMGIEPLPLGHIPLSVRGLIQAVKAYEELTIEAAITGDRGIALQALMTNPLVGSYDKASKFLARLLEADRDYLPRFWH
jgi:6-phospho-beta-glucosidase